MLSPLTAHIEVSFFLSFILSFFRRAFQKCCLTFLSQFFRRHGDGKRKTNEKKKEQKFKGETYERKITKEQLVDRLKEEPLGPPQ